MATNLLLLATLLAAPPVYSRVADDPDPSAQAVYDESADAAKQVDAAVARAARDGKRVLVVWGANWCSWCKKLHGLFEKNEAIATLLRDEYEVVLVDVGKHDKNQELAKKLGAVFKGVGIPFLTVLDGEGKPIVQQATGPLEIGPAHDPTRVIAFLREHAVPPDDAEPVLAAALARAKAESKIAFVRFGAPTCPWCHKLDAWVADPAVAAVLGGHAVTAKIDIERMKNGAAVIQRWRKDEQSGIPWFVFLDAEGKALATSDGPKGNVGFPQADPELEAFHGMLTAAGFTPEDSKKLRDSLIAVREAAKPK